LKRVLVNFRAYKKWIDEFDDWYPEHTGHGNRNSAIIAILSEAMRKTEEA